jgi:hypothetical protein
MPDNPTPGSTPGTPPRRPIGRVGQPTRPQPIRPVVPAAPAPPVAPPPPTPSAPAPDPVRAASAAATFQQAQATQRASMLGQAGGPMPGAPIPGASPAPHPGSATVTAGPVTPIATQIPAEQMAALASGRQGLAPAIAARLAVAKGGITPVVDDGTLGYESEYAGRTDDPRYAPALAKATAPGQAATIGHVALNRMASAALPIDANAANEQTMRRFAEGGGDLGDPAMATALGLADATGSVAGNATMVPNIGARGSAILLERGAAAGAKRIAEVAGREGAQQVVREAERAGEVKAAGRVGRAVGRVGEQAASVGRVAKAIASDPAARKEAATIVAKAAVGGAAHGASMGVGAALPAEALFAPEDGDTSLAGFAKRTADRAVSGAALGAVMGAAGGVGEATGAVEGSYRGGRATADAALEGQVPGQPKPITYREALAKRRVDAAEDVTADVRNTRETRVTRAEPRVAYSARSPEPAPPGAPRLPKTTLADGARRRARNAVPDALEDARAYNAAHDGPPVQEMPYAEVPESSQRTVAELYDAAPIDDKSPETHEAYRALADEVERQYDFLTQDRGVTFTFTDHDPYQQQYANGKPVGPSPSEQMMRDARERRGIKVFKTPNDSFHPHLSAEQNDKFRAIHDWLGHAAHGNEFGPRGEWNAFGAHMQMFSPEAQRAAATELRGQNAWTNFKGDHPKRPIAERPFAPQKTFTLPDELALQGADGTPGDFVRANQTRGGIRRAALERRKLARMQAGEDTRQPTSGKGRTGLAMPPEVAMNETGDRPLVPRSEVRDPMAPAPHAARAPEVIVPPAGGSKGKPLVSGADPSVDLAVEGARFDRAKASRDAKPTPKRDLSGRHTGLPGFYSRLREAVEAQPVGKKGWPAEVWASRLKKHGNFAQAEAKGTDLAGYLGMAEGDKRLVTKRALLDHLGRTAVKIDRAELGPGAPEPPHVKILREKHAKAKAAYEEAAADRDTKFVEIGDALADALGFDPRHRDSQYWAGRYQMHRSNGMAAQPALDQTLEDYKEIEPDITDEAYQRAFSGRGRVAIMAAIDAYEEARDAQRDTRDAWLSIDRDLKRDAKDAKAHYQSEAYVRPGVGAPDSEYVEDLSRDGRVPSDEDADELEESLRTVDDQLEAARDALDEVIAEYNGTVTNAADARTAARDALIAWHKAGGTEPSDALTELLNEEMETARVRDALEREVRDAERRVRDLQAEREQLLTRKSVEPWDAPHFDDDGKNLISHARLTTQKAADGEGVTLMEELQSDRGQAIRKRGAKGSAFGSAADRAEAAKLRAERTQIEATAGAEQKAITAERERLRDWYDEAHSNTAYSKRTRGGTLNEPIYDQVNKERLGAGRWKVTGVVDARGDATDTDLLYEGDDRDAAHRVYEHHSGRMSLDPGATRGGLQVHDSEREEREAIDREYNDRFHALDVRQTEVGKLWDRLDHLREDANALDPWEGKSADEAGAYDSRPPSTPFDDTSDWVKLEVRKALQRAVQRGHGYLAWATGRDNAARYGLESHADRLEWVPEGRLRGGTLYVKKDGNTVKTIRFNARGDDSSGNDLGAYVGEWAEVLQQRAKTAPTVIPMVEAYKIGGVGHEEQWGVRSTATGAHQYGPTTEGAARDMAQRANAAVAKAPARGVVDLAAGEKVGGKGMGAFYGQPEEGKAGSIEPMVAAVLRDLGVTPEIIDVPMPTLPLHPRHGRDAQDESDTTGWGVLGITWPNDTPPTLDAVRAVMAKPISSLVVAKLTFLANRMARIAQEQFAGARPEHHGTPLRRRARHLRAGMAGLDRPQRA